VKQATLVLKRDYVGQELCSVARTLEIIGDRWTWVIIRDAFLGLASRSTDSLGRGPTSSRRSHALRQWGDRYLCAKPMRLLRVKGSETSVIAALVPEGAPVLSNEQIELVPGPGFPASTLPDERAPGC
jgi:hypothetical protein